MPNHVSNRIVIIGTQKGFQDTIVNTITTNNGDGDQIDFKKLIPIPRHIYQNHLSKDDELDFQSHNCWSEWNRKNWGTKWNAYETVIKYGDELIIDFQTAWSVPYPFIIALSNLLATKFKLKYYDEGGCFWGIEEWEDGKRTKKNRDKSIKDELKIELLGFDPDDD